ncbi:MAG: helix-turn-helix domain-containing protein [bacterium]|nr:helix-turn-helix domain-containing protein [bacterium]
MPDYPAADPEGMITIRRAAALLRVSIRTARRYVQEGRFPAWKLGAVLWVHESDVRDYVEKCRVTS